MTVVPSSLRRLSRARKSFFGVGESRGARHVKAFKGASLKVLSWVATTFSRRAALIVALLAGLAAAGFFPMITLLFAKTPG